MWPLPLRTSPQWSLVCPEGQGWAEPLTADLCSPHIQDSTEVVVKEVLAGDSVHSLLSILDVITVSAPLVCPRSPGHRSLSTKATRPLGHSAGR